MYARYSRYYRSRLTSLWIILGPNIVLFIATLFYPGLIYIFGLKPSDILNEPWTIVTSMFIHLGFWHIFANMFALYFLGAHLSMLIGERKFLIVYFCGGILGGVLFVLLARPSSIAVGASGAIFALGGALAVLRPKLKVIVFPIIIPIPLWLAVTFGFLIVSFFPNVAWQAHLGGLVLGIVAGYLFRRKQRPILFF